MPLMGSPVWACVENAAIANIAQAAVMVLMSMMNGFSCVCAGAIASRRRRG